MLRATRRTVRELGGTHCSWNIGHNVRHAHGKAHPAAGIRIRRDANDFFNVLLGRTFPRTTRTQDLWRGPHVDTHTTCRPANYTNRVKALGTSMGRNLKSMVFRGPAS